MDVGEAMGPEGIEQPITSPVRSSQSAQKKNLGDRVVIFA
jgi:hypothetical protein